MVTQQVEVGAQVVVHPLDRHDRQAEVGPAPYGLEEDAQVVRRGLEHVVPFNGPDRVDQSPGAHQRGNPAPVPSRDHEVAMEILLWSPTISRWARGSSADGSMTT